VTTTNNGKMMMPASIRRGRKIVTNLFWRGGKRMLRRMMRARGKRNAERDYLADGGRATRETVDDRILW